MQQQRQPLARLEPGQGLAEDGIPALILHPLLHAGRVHRQGDSSLPVVQRHVGSQPPEPWLERAVGIEAAQIAVEAKEDLLRKIVGLGRVVDVVIREAVDPVLIPGDQCLESVPVATCRGANERRRVETGAQGPLATADELSHQFHFTVIYRARGEKVARAAIGRGGPVISRHLLGWLGILGVTCDLLGGLYLAYDLLGGRRGLLRTLTRAATYAIGFGVIYTAGLWLPFGPIAGIGLGMLLGLEYGLRREETAVSLLFALLRGAVFGLAGFALNGPRFGLVLGIGAAVGLFSVYHWLRLSVARDYPTRGGWRPRFEVGRAQAVRATAIVVAAIIAGLVAGGGVFPALLLAVRLGIVSWVAGYIVGTTSPIVEPWADRLPPRRLGVVGALLILVGLLIQTVQYWVLIFDVQVR